jgi:hypothetical protein
LFFGRLFGNVERMVKCNKLFSALYFPDLKTSYQKLSTLYEALDMSTNANTKLWDTFLKNYLGIN